MTISNLLKKLLGVKPIVIEDVEIEARGDEEELVVRAKPTRKESCRCGICGRKCRLYDRGRGVRRWRSMDIGNSMRVFIEAEAPRVYCEKHGVVVQRFPWARHGSRFTKAFEETAVWLSLHLSRKDVAEYLRVSWDTVGPILTRVERELSEGRSPFDRLASIGIDETSYKKGHKYITVIVNHETNAVIWVGKGYGKSVLDGFFQKLSAEQKKSIRFVTGDGARWIRDTALEHCPDATFCIDPFHVVSWATEALDQVRRDEWNKVRIELAKERKGREKPKRGRPKGEKASKSVFERQVEDIKSAKYPLLMNPNRLNESYKAKLSQILLHNRRLATAYHLKEELRLIFKLPPDELRSALMKWRRRAWSCRNPIFVELQRKIKRHMESIIATVTNGLSNARIEATNNKIKLSVRMAYGFRNIDNLISLVMLRCGYLPVALPGRSSR